MKVMILLFLLGIVLAYSTAFLPSQVSAISNYVIDTISTPNSPFNLAVNPSNGILYATDPSDDSVSVIDAITNEVIDIIDVCDSPWGIAYNPINNYVYTNCESGKTVAIIDSSTNEIIDTVVTSTEPVGGSSPTGITVNPYTGHIYSTVGFLDRVAVIDKDTNDVIENIPVGDSPWSISFNAYNSLIYVGNFNLGTISVIDSDIHQVIKNIPIGPNPREFAINPTNGNVYVAISSANKVSVIDGNTNEVIDNIAVGMQPIGIAFNPSNQYVYVANAEINADPHTVSVIDSNTNQMIEEIVIEQTSDIGLALPLGLAFNPINNYVYLATAGAQRIYIISSSPPDTTITSVVDGTNISINNEGSTLSNKITFIFESAFTSSTFECSLNNEVFSSCTSPVTYNNLNSGTHTFQVAALGDPTPAAFTWTLLTSSEAIDKLIDTVKNLDDVDFRINYHLLRLVSIVANDKNLSNDLISCTIANIFTSTVNTFESRGLLSAIQADDLKQQAEAIKNEIGCNIPRTSGTTTDSLS